MTHLIHCRKRATYIEEVWHDGGTPRATPLRKGAVVAVVANPFAGHYAEDLSGWMEALGPLGDSMAQQLLDAMGVAADAIESFGKGTIVGVNGDIEVGAAWHNPGGGALKRLLGVKGFVTAGQILGAVGTSLHVPMVSVHSPWVRSHFDSVDIAVADAPRPNEVLYALAMADGGRVDARLGGLSFADGASGKGPPF